MTNYILLIFLYNKRNDNFQFPSKKHRMNDLSLKLSDPPRSKHHATRASPEFSKISLLFSTVSVIFQKPAICFLLSKNSILVSNCEHPVHREPVHGAAFPQCVAGGSGLRLPGNLRSPGGDARERRWTAASRTTTKRGGTIQEGGGEQPPRPPKFFSLSPFVFARVLSLSLSSLSSSCFFYPIAGSSPPPPPTRICFSDGANFQRYGSIRRRSGGLETASGQRHPLRSSSLSLLSSTKSR